ncbi:MAG: hypothetical protein Q8N17_26065 [Burkholderiaceae bacterium]|nr:hypothetical protein [Burkholderiaceae bacterium]
MEFRRLTIADIEPVAAFAVEGMRPHLYPAQRLSVDKVRAVVRHFHDTAGDFHLLAFDAGRLVAAMAATLQESLFFERCEAHLLMCRAVVPGAAPQMFTALRTWFEREPRARRMTWPQEFDAGPGMTRLMRRYGFKQCITTCVHYKD